MDAVGESSMRLMEAWIRTGTVKGRPGWQGRRTLGVPDSAGRRFLPGRLYQSRRIVNKLVRLKLTSEQEKAVHPLLEQAKRATSINGLLAVVHRQWDTTSASGLVLIMEIARLDAKTSRRIVKLIQDAL
jgi:hypothetical protein